MESTDDKWISDNLSYAQTLNLFKETNQEGQRIFTRIIDYFNFISARFNKFIEDESLRSLPHISVDSHRASIMPNKSKPLVPGFMTSSPTPGTRQSVDIMPSSPTSRDSPTYQTAQLCQIQPFRVAAEKLKTEYIPYLVQLRQDYFKKMMGVTEKASGALKSLQESKDRRKSAYEIYCQAGENLKAAYDSKSPELEILKRSFLEAQKNAVDTHTHMNEVTAQTAMKMESAITEFEDIERWRSDSFKDIMKRFSDWLGMLGGEVKKGNSYFDQLLQLVPNDEDLEKNMNVSELPVPAADVDYQIVPLSLLFSKFLPADEIFKNEIKNGGRLFRVKEDCPAHGQFLNVVAGEIIVSLSMSGNNILAKDINDCEGLVPTRAVEPL
ncbi:hypothetical protein TRFO_03820 [Tritrichomonas foetus]|uniref:F-BAR domain-containing protein n=1 Tax=Tritrichomonas foetus TaxID=1144522 RepID=A0A1J4KPA2_9EUKA|nr:hypothetical protein TRFO_03820 [Tritrichomonas foetus]|eukprot:OHT11628.1 hypothetical protein TRFO_03820 [Tritrichomonas foetus]